MSDDHAARLAALEQLDEDLFDFPDVEGMADLLASARAGAAGSAPTLPASKPASGKARGAAEAQGEPRAPLPASKGSAAPRNAADLDEDLFGFGANDSLSESSRLAEPTAEAPPQKALRQQPAATASTPAVAPLAASEATSEKPREPKRKKGEGEPRTGARAVSTTDTAPGQTPADNARVPEPAGPTGPTGPSQRELAHTSLATNSPFLTFPAAIDLPPARSKLLWVLVGCFLLANGGVFLMTQQQNQNVNETLVAVTSTLAEAVARGSNAAPREAPPQREPVAHDVDTARTDAPMFDPADFSNTNELGLHNARRLIEQGAYAEARRNLFFILANQDRSTPLTPALREDIDYLIALTYYDQGRSIAVEESR